VLCLSVHLKKQIAIHTFSIDLPESKQIDLCKAAEELNAKYNPEVTGIHGMFIRFEEITFCVYSNGSICAYGCTSIDTKKNAINRLWWDKLRFFLV